MSEIFRTIKIKRGLKANLPTLEVGEMGFCTDTVELFIGTDDGNELLTPPIPRTRISEDNVDLVEGDEGYVIIVDSGEARTITVPSDVSEDLPINSEIGIVQLGVGAVNISCVDGVTINGNSHATSYSIEAQYKAVALKKIGVDTWLLLGAFEEV